jgi:integrase
MAKFNPLAEVRQVNLWLKSDCHRVAIQVRGGRLSLVATLPPKPDSTKRKPHQQRIPLKLSATAKGLRRAKLKALALSDEIERDRFTWENWINLPSDEPEIQTCGYWLERFKQHVLPQLAEDKQYNWTKRYLYFGLNQLPLDSPLTPEVLIAAALTKDPARKAARDRTCDRLQEFAKFAGIEVDLKPLKTGYSPADVKPKKDMPDSEIERIINSISNPQWRYIFALMATYGLRDHEAFLCTLETRDDVTVAIIPDDTKTGHHIAYPHPAHWVDLWLQGTLTRPTVEARANEQYGAAAAAYWRQKRMPNTPYALRHAYAVRCHAAGVSVAIAAAWMGHSPEMHLKAYQRWISETVHREAWERLQSRTE